MASLLGNYNIELIVSFEDITEQMQHNYRLAKLLQQVVALVCPSPTDAAAAHLYWLWCF